METQIILILASLSIFGALLKAIWSLTDLHTTVQAVHQLVNSAMEVQLAERLALCLANLTKAERLAHLTGLREDTEGVELAREALLIAKRLYNEHLLHQQQTGRRTTTPLL